jgi:hypothetical protein
LRVLTPTELVKVWRQVFLSVSLVTWFENAGIIVPWPVIDLCCPKQMVLSSWQYWPDK